VRARDIGSTPKTKGVSKIFRGKTKTCGNKALISHLEFASWKTVSVYNYLNSSQRRNTPKLSCYIFSGKDDVIKKNKTCVLLSVQTRPKKNRQTHGSGHIGCLMRNSMGSPILHQAPAAFLPELRCESPLGAAAEMSCAIFGMEKTGKFIEVNAGCVEIATFDDTVGYL
jgi:hypothetical protein